MGYNIRKLQLATAEYAASETGYVVLPISLSAEHMRNGFRILLKLEQCDVTTQIDVSLLEQLAGDVSNVVKTVSPADQAAQVSIRMHPGVPADAALFPLLPNILVQVTTGSGDALVVSDAWIIEADE